MIPVQQYESNKLYFIHSIKLMYMIFRYADLVLVGDEVLVQGINGLAHAKVMNVSSQIIMQGITS